MTFTITTKQLTINFSAPLENAAPISILANVTSRSRSLIVVARPSVCLPVVCNARAPYAGGCNFRQYFDGIWYPGHPLTYRKNFPEIVPGKCLRRGVKQKRVAKYSDFGHIEGYISETVQDRR